MPEVPKGRWPRPTGIAGPRNKRPGSSQFEGGTRENEEMPNDTWNSAMLNRGQAGLAASDIKKGTVFVRPALLAGSSRLEAKVRGSWLVVTNALSEEVDQAFTDLGWSFSGDTPIEASAFGCDSKVLDRALDRTLQKAADNGVDILEIIEVTSHENSGLDYVSILACGRGIREASISDNVGFDVSSTALSTAG